MQKKLFFVVIILAAAATVFSQAVTDFGVELTDDGGGVRITKYLGKAAAVRIPAVIEDLPVKEIGNSAFSGYNNNFLNNGCPNYITSVTFPQGLVKIGTSAFQGCNMLQSVVLPDSVTEIGDYAFMDCFSVLLTGDVGIRSVTLSRGLTKVGMSAFQGNRLLATLVIPQGVTVIGHSMFSHCIPSQRP